MEKRKLLGSLGASYLALTGCINLNERFNEERQYLIAEVVNEKGTVALLEKCPQLHIDSLIPGRYSPETYTIEFKINDEYHEIDFKSREGEGQSLIDYSKKIDKGTLIRFQPRFIDNTAKPEDIEIVN